MGVRRPRPGREGRLLRGRHWLPPPEWRVAAGPPARSTRCAGCPRPGSSASWGGTLWAGPEAAISHRAAAALWKLEGVAPGVVDPERCTKGPHPPPDDGAGPFRLRPARAAQGHGHRPRGL